MVLIVLFAIGCSNKPSKTETVIKIQDNNKNLVWISNTTNSTEGMILIQKWIDEHPTKKIVALSSDSTGLYGEQTGWLLIYENR